MSDDTHVIGDAIISDQAAKQRAALLAALSPDERKAADAAMDALLRRALSTGTVMIPREQATPGNVLTTLEGEPEPVGATTSEGKRSLAQQILGAVLALAGSIVAMLTASKPDNPILPIVAAVIAGIGGLIGGNAQSVYTKARSAVKIGAAPLLLLFVIVASPGCSFVQGLICTEPPSSLDREYIANVQATRKPSIDALAVCPIYFTEDGKAKLQTILNGFAAQEAYEKSKLPQEPPHTP